MKIIAFSLWGDNSRYTLGALQNASLAKMVYPDWVCRFYVGKSTPRAIVDLLREFDNVEIVLKDEDGPSTGMFWRYYCIDDPDVEVSIFRDCDSRLWFREKAAVDEWLASDNDFHIMRDNHQHNVPILGGMWGVKRGALTKVKEKINYFCVQQKLMLGECKESPFYNKEQEIIRHADQYFLQLIIVPMAATSSCVHDEFFDEQPYPTTPRDENHFVGQAYAGTGKILDQEEYFQDFMRREYGA